MPVTQVGTPAAPAVQLGSLTPSLAGTWSGTQPRTAGDLLVALVTNWGQATVGVPPDPSGWTQGPQVIAGAGPQAFAGIWTRVAAGGDTPPTFTATNTGSTGSSRMVVEMVELTGNDLYAAVCAQGTGTATSGLALSMATSGNVPDSQGYAVSAWNVGNTVAAAVTFTAGPGFSKITDDGATATLRSHSGFDRTTSATPPLGQVLTDALSWTTTTTPDAAGAIIVVRPVLLLPQQLGRHTPRIGVTGAPYQAIYGR